MGDLRYKQHLGQARRGDHENPNIQEVYDKYGYDDWVHKWLSTETGDKRHHDTIEFGYVQSDPKSLNVKTGKISLLSEEDHKERGRLQQQRRKENMTPEELEESRRKQREYMTQLRNNETSEQREERLRKQGIYNKQKRNR
tara:strand:+ start:173 stop:595 length:423 start_codon:yes stop_codon:yes gene_type:complete